MQCTSSLHIKVCVIAILHVCHAISSTRVKRFLCKIHEGRVGDSPVPIKSAHLPAV